MHCILCEYIINHYIRKWNCDRIKQMFNKIYYNKLCWITTFNVEKHIGTHTHIYIYFKKNTDNFHTYAVRSPTDEILKKNSMPSKPMYFIFINKILI